MKQITMEVQSAKDIQLLLQLAERLHIKAKLEADETVQEHSLKRNTMASFWGILNDKDAKELRKQVEQSRNEWERDI